MPDKRTQLSLLILPLAAWGMRPAAVSGGSPIRDQVQAAGQRLTSEQRCSKGPSGGSWPGEETHTAPIVAGLAGAYRLTCDESFRAAAQAGAKYILRFAADNFHGDEAYALASLSDILSDDADIRRRLGTFYVNVQAGGTRGYLGLLSEQDKPSDAVFEAADYTVAAFLVDANDKQIWRDGLMSCLARIDDATADCPVRALGVAVWALAGTGPLDDSPVDPSGQGRSYWRNRTLVELPGLLMEHWVAEGYWASSFYRRFDHGNGGIGPVAGYTEDAVFGALGLATANRVLEDPNVEAALARVRDVLVACIDERGFVHEHLWLGGNECYLYSGEVIQAVAALTNSADLNLGGRVDGADLAAWPGSWRCASGRDRCSCRRADINHDGRVDERDLLAMTRQWLRP